MRMKIDIIVILLLKVFLLLGCNYKIGSGEFRFYEDGITKVDYKRVLGGGKQLGAGVESAVDGNVEILLDKVIYYLPEGRAKKLIMQSHQITKVLKDKTNANTLITYLVGREKLRHVEAYIIDGYGNKRIAEIESRNMFEKDLLNARLYEDVKVVSLRFLGVPRGATINIRYEMELDYRGLEGGDFYLWDYEYVGKRKYVLIVPRGKNIKLFYKGEGTSYKPTIYAGKRYKHYVFETDDIKKVKREGYIRDIKENGGRIKFSFNGSLRNLAKRLNYEYRRYKHIPKTKSFVKANILNVGRGGDAGAEYIYNHVTNPTNIKNVLLPFSFGRLRPSNPDEVLMNGYGDIKDKAFLLYSLLKEAGFKVYIGLTSTKSSLDEEVVSLNDIDTLVVAIDKGGGKYVYMDPQSVLVRYGNLPSKLYGRKVYLLLGLEGGKAKELLQKVVQSGADNKLLERGQVNVLSDVIYYETEYEPKGSYETKERLEMAKIKYKDTLKSLEDNYKEIHIKLAESDRALGDKVLRFETVEPLDLTKPFKYKVKTKSSLKDAKRVSININLSRKEYIEGLNFDIKREHRNVVYGQIFVLRKEYVINYAKGHIIRVHPKALRYEDEHLFYSRSYKIKGSNKLIYKREFKLKRPVINKSEYKIFKEGLKKILKYEKEMLILEKTEQGRKKRVGRRGKVNVK